ncbi:MAG: hypothetical protein DRP96_03755 [Candidatus Neomarinimicrobiota bacterium]|nr:MAG: hypothetical protein DRP96_03755 [Candidatus Neomarinimicrobiota bacterium]
MAQIRILYHHVSENLQRHMAGILAPELDSGKKIDVLMPSINHLRSFKETLLPKVQRLLPGQLFLGTFYAWANRILDADKKSFRIVNTGEEWLLLFGYLNKHAELFPDLKPGSLSLIQKIVTELRETHLSVKQLNSLAEKYPEISVYVKCLNFLMDTAGTRHLASSSTLLQLVSESLSGANFKPVADTFVVAGFYEFNAIQKKILNLLIERYSRVILYFPEKSDHPAMKFIQPLPDILYGKTFKSEKIGANRINTTQKIADLLYTVTPDPKDNESYPKSLWFNHSRQDVAVKVLRCPTRRREVDAAARTVKKWMGDGIKAEDIAVIYREPQNYPQYIRLIFPALGIPLKRNGHSLQETSPVRILQKIIEVNEQNFSRDSVIDLIRFKEIRDYYGNEIIQKFEYHSGSLGLSFNKESWQTQLKRRQKYLQSVLTVSDEENKDTTVLHRELRDIEMLLPVLQRFFDDIELPVRGGWSEYIRRLWSLTKTYFSSNDGFAEVLNKISEVLRNILTLVDGRAIVNRRHFSMAFNELTGAVSLPQPEYQTETGLVVDELINVRHRCFKAVILLGFVDTEFPVSPRDNLLMNSQQRVRFNQMAGMELFHSPGMNIEEEKFLFYHLMSRVDDYLLITYPQFGSNGRNFAESPFLDELIAIAIQTEPKADIRFESLSASKVIPDSETTVTSDDLCLNLLHYRWDGSARVFFTKILDKARLERIQRRVNIEDQRRRRMMSVWNGGLTTRKHRDFCFKSPLSVTRLQQYAWCPFLYLCESVWKIDAVEEPSPDIPALSDGILIHALLEKFLKTANAHNFDEWRVFISGDLESKKARVLSAIDNKYRTVFSHIEDPIWNKKMIDLKRGLNLFIQREIDALSSGFYPSEFENTLYYSFPIVVENREMNIPFKVKIDRIDRKSDSFTLIEYKRSRNSVQDPVKGVDEGIHFQIPVYLLAYRARNPELRCAGAYSYMFNEGKIAKGIFTEKLFARNRPMTEAEFANLLDKTRNKVMQLLLGIYSGDFFLNPHDVSKRCQHGKCPYYELCRIDSGTVENNGDSDD